MTKNQNAGAVKYSFSNFNPSEFDPQNIDRLAVENVPEKSLVLDIGCATGFMGEYLIKHKQCRVFGVEIRPKEAELAKRNLNGICVTDIEDKTSIEKILKLTEEKSRFDVIIATSVIEHLKDATNFLEICRKLLKPQGILIVSTPNIAHWTMRVSLLRGKFNYTDYGILDTTHLHFFTKDTFSRLFIDNNYMIKKFLIDPVGGGYTRVSRLLSRWFPGMFAYQFLIIAQPNE